MDGYTNGYIQQTSAHGFQGNITIEGINLGVIIGTYFKKDGDMYLWLKRKKVLEYNDDTVTYYERDAQPRWECYLKKQTDGNTVAYKGEFFFIHFKYSIVGVYDNVLGKDKRRLNLFVDRLPMSQQSVVNDINSRKRSERNERRTI